MAVARSLTAFATIIPVTVCVLFRFLGGGGGGGHFFLRAILLKAGEVPVSINEDKAE